ncbi:MAG: 3-dehydroquinate synthase [Deltaproteobacteria bacterium CG11_big_fil_rev_8_21_14_0_20_47_16]|nr:MAG: 3-dehydroquinate synthase [Deltaproteobacteria bacterium CG11_big_fil_rev_8_21_14_0_20_47_16]
MSHCVTVKIPAEKSAQYPIWIGAGVLNKLPLWLRRHYPKHTVVVISDKTVMRILAKKVVSSIRQKKFKVVTIEIPAGEKSKSRDVMQSVEKRMFAEHCGRDTIIIAMGGGVVGDLAGFVAATYMRGLPYIQVPTSLLAMVDSSVGGKTGIDTDYGKNLLGAFWQPKAVFADTKALKTLPSAHIVNGLVEALKMFMTHDAKSFSYAVHNLDKALACDVRILASIIQRAVTIKAAVVQRDEKESGERMTLNFGHTIGHAVEHLSNYKVMHGAAVAMGILLEAKIAEMLGLLSEQGFQIIRDVLAELDITPRVLKQLNIDHLLKATQLDKKKKQGKVHYVLLSDLGKVHQSLKQFAHYVPDGTVRRAYKTLIGA